MRGLVKLLLSVGVVSFLVTLAFSGQAHASYSSTTLVNQHCSPDSIHRYGYVEHMGLTDSRGNFLISSPSSNQRVHFNVTGNATYVDVHFKVEVWLCKDRYGLYPNGYLLTDRYRAIRASGSTSNLFTNISPSSARIYPAPSSSHSSVIRSISRAHYMRVPVHKARLNIQGFADGSTTNICLRKRIYSNVALPEHIEGPRYCFNVTINRDYNVRANATTNISSGTANVGQSVTWTHTITNAGPGNTKNTIRSWEVDQNKVNLGRAGSTASGIRPNATIRRFTSSYVIQPEDVGKRICRGAAYTPRGMSNGSVITGTGYSTPACVTVPYNYALTPVINLSSDSIEQGASTVDGITARINNSGPTRSKRANFGVIRFVVKNNQTTTIPQGTNVKVPRDPANTSNLISDWPCEIARQIRSRTGLNIDTNNCSGGLPRASGEVPLGGRNISVTNPNNISSLDIDTNDRLCYTTVVSTYNADTGNDVFRYAQPRCLRVSKRPKVQFWGGDVRSEKDVTTSMTRKGTGSYGSWAEYALFSGGTASSSSGAGLSSNADGRGGISSTNQLPYNRLTFANTPSLGSFNSPATSLPPGFLSGGSAISSSTVDLGSLSSGTHVRSGNLTISASNLAANKRLVIRSTGTVTIRGNITYANGSYTNVRNIPRLTIIAQNIIVHEDVTQINAWLVAQGSGASGYISTCGSVATATPSGMVSGLDDKTCDKRLRINGPVVADHLYLRRTYGGNASNPGNPAEILNLRPDIHMSYYGTARDSGSIKTSYIRELPPRF